MLTTLEEVNEELLELITKEMAKINIAETSNMDLYKDMKVFQEELGVRDKPVFQDLLLAYAEERKQNLETIQVLVKLVNNIQKMFNIED